MNRLQLFTLFLNMSERSLKICIDLYNSGKMGPIARMVLESLEAAYDEDLVERI